MFNHLFIISGDLKDRQVHLEALELPGGKRRRGRNPVAKWTISGSGDGHEEDRRGIEFIQDTINT